MAASAAQNAAGSVAAGTSFSCVFDVALRCVQWDT
jgi:hypothetical protein